MKNLFLLLSLLSSVLSHSQKPVIVENENGESFEGRLQRIHRDTMFYLSKRWDSANITWGYLDTIIRKKEKPLPSIKNDTTQLTFNLKGDTLRKGYVVATGNGAPFHKHAGEYWVDEVWFIERGVKKLISRKKSYTSFYK